MAAERLVEGVRGPGRPDPPRHRRQARGGDATVGQLAEPYDDVPAGGLQAPQGARGRGAGHPQPRRPAPSRPPRGGGVRPDDHVDRAVPPRRRRSATGAWTTSSRPCPDQPSRTDQQTTHQQKENAMTTTTETGSTSTRPAHHRDHPRVRRTRSKVFRAHADPDLVRQWLGPRGHPDDVDRWDCRTGGSTATSQPRRRGVSRVPRVLPRGPPGASSSSRPSPTRAARTACALENACSRPGRRAHPARRDIARRLVGGARRDGGQRHGAGHRRGLRAARRAARRAGLIQAFRHGHPATPGMAGGEAQDDSTTLASSRRFR